MNRKFFQIVSVSVWLYCMLFYDYATWTFSKQSEKKLDNNYTRVRHALFEQIQEAAWCKTDVLTTLISQPIKMSVKSGAILEK